ncbi:unnamed protein product [Candidula unifasciata]|uniref:Uncharacterized protein n=1 Tax=Candidula unifasciata TaxID=100452 RepID=A0A8S3ZFS5_9EUPU|nr:unnamed protein product [Candidula unifasciata]
MESLQSNEELFAHASGQRQSIDYSQDCPRGCGLSLTTTEDKEHNCITKLRTTIEELRTEMTCKMEDQKREMEAMFDLQRGHMLKKETALQGQIEALKTELSRLGERLKTLLDVEMNRQQELDRLTSERAEIMALLKELQSEKQNTVTLCQHCSLGNKGKVTNV